MSVKNLFKRLLYQYGLHLWGNFQIQGGENPLDYKKIEESDVELRVVATINRKSNEAYFDKTDMCQDNYSIIRKHLLSISRLSASRIGSKGVPYYDGRLSDPIPVQKALDDGCDKVVVIHSKADRYDPCCEKRCVSAKGY